MTIFELLTFLVVTCATGAGIGCIAGLALGNVAQGAKAGTLLGPVLGAIALTIWALVLKLKTKHNGDEDRTTEST